MGLQDLTPVALEGRVGGEVKVKINCIECKVY